MSNYHLTPEQIQFYDDNGYLILRNWIGGALLERLHNAGHVWIEQGMNAAEDDPNKIDYLFAQRSSGKRAMWRVDYVHNKGQAASLELLGSPQVLGVAESMCGANFVPTYESMVFKQEGDGEAIKWHQDATHPRSHRIFNYDLYLDASLSGGGALWVIPGTHYQKQDICLLTDTYGWQAPGAIEVEMHAGDVLLHDVMVVHGSPHTEGNRLRRTIYYEFRAAEEIVQDGPWDRTWIDQRMRLIPLALRHHAQAFPNDTQFQWNASDEFRPAISEDEEAELRVAHLVHMNGSFCSAGSVQKQDESADLLAKA
jgi:ectoine hydroxylase-related dioxygenase (phytanoyl-CoA dioxygenase family)